MAVEVEGLRELQDAFRQLGKDVQRTARRVVRRAAVNVKADARKRIESMISDQHSYLPHYPASIDFDMDGRTAAVIGPNIEKKQGKFGRGVEFGSARTPPMPHMLPAADAEEPRFLQAMGDEIGKLLP
ncbi:HK97-gp10 family putative phage morphogenesis protein [Nakamurella aerolata]|uniref:HK97 gp10 family phage protein n=1 Tax=Nakamurella aerolata TaxID=1656892 RepID=A0A849AB99_9ACTN|nr:HK97-gp10 family putative phage morphogenesis protein [Nakamurella aerolata]NNG36943.1 hypothetical protein [Nakamurella aerolata]